MSMFEVWEFKNLEVPSFLKGFDNSELRTIDDIVRYNENNKDVALTKRKSAFSLIIFSI
jgi:hypothetical protein